MYFFAWENPATNPYLGSKVNRAAGRVIECACVSVTIDAPMKFFVCRERSIRFTFSKREDSSAGYKHSDVRFINVKVAS